MEEENIVLAIGAVLGDWYKYVKETMKGDAAEWVVTTMDALERIYRWASQNAERHERLHNSLSFMFLFFCTSRKILIGLLGLVWAVFSYLLGSVWTAFSFIVGSLWGGICFVVMSVWGVLAFLLGAIWVAISFVVGSIWAALSFLVGSIWMALSFLVEYIWVALCFIAGSVWLALSFVAGLVWAALPFFLVSGLVVYAGFLIWGEYLELLLTTLKTNPKGPLIRIDVSYGSACHELIVPAFSTFGDVKKSFAKRTGLEPGKQRLLFGGKEKKDEEHLHKAGVIDESKVWIR